jgi:hypothetical protein
MSLPKLNTPIFELTQPSTGKKIKYRPFLVKEHKVLLAMADADNTEVTRIICELIDACTFNKLKVSDLPHFDTEYIFLNLRAKSISEKVDVIVNCDCGNKIETSFNIDDLKIIKQPDHTNRIKLDDMYSVEMRYPPFQDVLEVYASEDAEKVVDMITRNIAGIYDAENYWHTSEQAPEEVKEFVLSLTKEQFDKIEAFFITAPKVTQHVEADCEKCGKHTETVLEGLSNFFV